MAVSLAEAMVDEYYEDYYYDEQGRPLSSTPAPFFDASSPDHRNAADLPLAKAFTLPELDDDEKACMSLLRGVPIFVHLSDEGLHTMVSNSTVRNFKRGSPIIAQGSRSSGDAATPESTPTFPCPHPTQQQSPPPISRRLFTQLALLALGCYSPLTPFTFPRQTST